MICTNFLTKSPSCGLSSLTSELTLACCGAEAGKGGKLELVVADPTSWDKIAAEQAGIQEKLNAIETMVQRLDAIFAEMHAAGIEAREKTIRSIWMAEQSRRTKVIDPHTGTNVDRWGHRIPQKQDARLVAWGERAEAALEEAQRIVAGPRITPLPRRPIPLPA